MNGASDRVQTASTQSQEALEPGVNAGAEEAYEEKREQCSAPHGESGYVRSEGLRGRQQGGERSGDVDYDLGHLTNMGWMRL